MTANINLGPLHDALTDLYEVFKGVCERHGLKFYASGGTALGAMRHQGYIPWDDDLDIEMPRADYEKFRVIVENELPPGVRFVCWQNTYGYNYLFAKLMCTDMERIRYLEEKLGMPLTQGLFIDIFPADFFPKSKIAQLVRLFVRAIVKTRQYDLRGEGQLAKRFFSCLVSHPFKLWHGKIRTYYDTLRVEDKIISSCSEKDAGLMGISAWYVFDWYLFKKRFNITPEDYGKPTEVSFERTTIPVPQNIEHYLSERYGNWRQLPPENKRCISHAAGIIAPWRYGQTVAKKQPILSIVIANYNYGRFIGSAIESILNQCWGVAKGASGQTVLGLPNGENVELIVVDGGSTDNSVEIIRKYDSHITWWVSENDKGQSDAFNKGFSRATGKYLTWVNADDQMVPGSLLAITRAMINNPSCEWFTGNFFWFRDSDNKVTEVCWGSNYYPRILQTTKSPVQVFGPSSFFSKRIYSLAGGIDIRFHNTMDSFLWVKFIQMGIKQRRIRKMCWAFRLHEGAKTAEYDGHERKRDSIEQSRRERKIMFDETGYAPSRFICLLIWAWRVLDFSIVCKLVLAFTHQKKSTFE